MPRQATIRDPQGNPVATLTIPDDATPEQIQQKLDGVKQQALARTPVASTTTTPTTRTFPQALGETAEATGMRAIGAGQNYLAQGILPHSMVAVGDLARTFLPVAAPEIALPGMAVETMRRITPGTTEQQAAAGAEGGQNVAALAMGARALLPVARAGLGGIGRLVSGAPKEASFGGVREAAMTKELTTALDKSGGALDQTTFAKQVRPSLRRMLRDAERTAAKGTPAQKAAAAPALNDLRTMVGRTESLGKVAHAVSNDPQLLATLVRDGGPDLLPQLQSAWMTGALSAATSKAGLARGSLDVPKLLNLWNDLGQEGQRALYGTRAPALRKLFTTIADTEPAAVEGAKAAKRGSGVLSAAAALLETGGIAHYLPGGRYLAGPFLMGRLLMREGGAEWLGDVATAMRDPRVWAQAAPKLAQAGVALIAQEGREGAPGAAPAASPAFAFAPPPAQAAPAQGPLDSPSGILAAIMGTHLPPGWRPGQPPVGP